MHSPPLSDFDHKSIDPRDDKVRADDMSSKILLKNATILSHEEDDQHVKVLTNTDLLIEGNTITKIDRDISLDDAPSHTVIDCTDKIISPGFTNTHAHLWQTQLKGRHADETLLDYYTSGNIQHNNYTPEDIFWGQLAGALESLDAGTTFVLDHAHCALDHETGEQALSGLITSGMRSVFGYGKPINKFSKWTMDEIVPEEGIPDLAVDHIERLAKGQPYGDGRVSIGMAFDMYWLPENTIKDAFTRVLEAGVKVVTSHVVRAVIFPPRFSTINTIKTLDLHTLTPSLVLSHCTNLVPEDYDTLRKTHLPISCTPETEAQMGHGAPVLFTPGLNTSLGVDCHTNNTSFMPTIARTGLFCARLTTNEELVTQGKFPGRLRGTTEQLFNKMTIDGARAVGMQAEIGSVRVGKRADVVVFDAKTSLGMCCVAETDPLCAVVRHSCVRDVETVIVDGVVRKKAGKLVSVVREGLDGKKVGEEMGWEVVREKLVKSTKDIWAKDQKCSRQLALELVLRTMGGDPEAIVDVD